jgi:hypothetical protein
MADGQFVRPLLLDVHAVWLRCARLLRRDKFATFSATQHAGVAFGFHCALEENAVLSATSAQYLTHEVNFNRGSLFLSPGR